MTNTGLFVQLFMGFLLNVALEGSSCPVTLNPPKVVVKYGDSVAISCTAQAEHYGMGWEAARGGTGPQTGNHVVWRVDNLTDMSREVMCFINPVSQPQCHQNADIVLYTVPDKVNITTNSSDGIMKEGKDYYLTCEADVMAPAESLSVMWYKDGRHFETFNQVAHENLNESKIYFTPTKEDQGAEFKCEVHLDLRPEGPYINASSQNIKIYVWFGPEMTCVVEKIAEGETLDSKCPVHGNPTPFVKWVKNGQEINSSRPLRREDAGIYSLNATGSDHIENNVTVFVLYGPELNCAPIHTALEHTTIKLNCTAGGYPTPNVTLYKEGEEVDLENTTTTRNDAGNYALVASIGTHNVTQTFEVIVYYPPSQIEDELQDSRFILGSSVDLKCAAKGNPRPKYKWIYYNTTNVSEKNDDGVSILMIHNATTLNIGSYTCYASNVHGTVSKTARLTVKGYEPECPLRITPAERMVLEYKSESKSATCESASAKEIYWQDNGEYHTSGFEWVADTHNWDARAAVCEAVFPGIGTCSKKLDIILYKKPDSVSISIKEDKVTLKELNFTLVCEITNVAPAKSVSVRFFKGNESVDTSAVHISCYGCNITETKRSVNMSFSTSISASRELNGVEFSCEAKFDLPEIQNITLPPSRPLNITVNYPPTINTTKLSSLVPVFSGYAEDLNCEADGNPRPEIRWSSNVTLPPQRSDAVLSVTEKGIYRCTATNSIGSDYHDVEVVVKVDYLPLIAGFVAVTVVIISIIFVFIYSIYYKNTKMRRYNLKNPKLGAVNNGNVANNGWDLPLPMTKLS